MRNRKCLICKCWTLESDFYEPLRVCAACADLVAETEDKAGIRFHSLGDFNRYRFNLLRQALIIQQNITQLYHDLNQKSFLEGTPQQRIKRLLNIYRKAGIEIGIIKGESDLLVYTLRKRRKSKYDPKK